MQGAIETLLSGLLIQGLRPALASILITAPMKKVARAQLKKIYVLDERGEMAGEYVLDPDCPIYYNDLLKVIPNEGIAIRSSLGSTCSPRFRAASTCSSSCPEDSWAPRMWTGRLCS